MDLYKYLCFILLTTVCYIDAIYVLTEKNYTWSEAKRACTLATPHLTFSGYGITSDLDNLLSVDAWLGYAEEMTPFEYFGCVRKDYLGLTTADYITEGDPGKCWSACNNVEAVAVYNNECFCLQTVTTDTNILSNNRCVNPCPSQQSFVCGGEQGQVYVSLYKVVTLDENQVQSANGACLWYDKQPPFFEWGNCNKLYRVICYDGEQVLVHRDANFSSWSASTVKCFKNGIPSNLNALFVNTDLSTQLWTGIIRNDVIYAIAGVPNETAEKHGYINATGNLSFTKSNTVTKRALCDKGTVTVETTTNTGKTTTYTGKTNTSTGKTTTSIDKTTTSSDETTTSTGKTTTSTGKTTTSTGEIATSTDETTTSTVKQTSSGSSDNSNEPTVKPSHTTDSKSEGTTNNQTITDENTSGKEGRLKKESSDVGAIVGASVAIIIVIIVGIVLVVLWKRGNKFPFKKARKLEKEKTQATNMTYSFARADNTIQGTDESSFTNYAEVDVSKMTLGGEVKDNGDTNRTSCSSNEPHTYFVLEKVDQGPYDTTKTTPQIHDQHTLNPYNKVSFEESSNYDHIGAHVNDSKTLGLDNTYNTTTLASTNTYNGFKNDAFKRNDESDDTYNHINGQSRQTERNQWDNPYNTTALGHLKSDHGVTNIAFNCNDEYDDTYNHIGDQSGQNDQTITDNPYNTTTLVNAQTNGVNNSAFYNNDDSEDTYNHINGQVSITRPTFTDNDYATLK